MSNKPKPRPGAANPRVTVFYDGGCPLCSREIAHYRGLDRACAMHWVDIATQAEEVEAHGLSVEQAMGKFHVLDAHGRWVTGAAGFAEIWSHLPGYRWLARGLRRAGMMPLLERVYAPFARWRLRRRCDADCSL